MFCTHPRASRAHSTHRLQSPRLARLAALLAALSTTALAAGARAEPAVSVERSTLKIRPDHVPGGALTTHLSAARNELESFQIAIRAPEGVTGIAATASALTGPGGAQIPASAIRFYRVDTMDVRTPSDAIGDTGKFPDPLVPAVDDLDGSPRSGFPFDAAPDQTRAIWVDLLVPADAAQGVYTGEVTLSGSGLEGQKVAIELRVRGFELPSTPTLATYFQLNDMNVCSGHYGGDPTCGGSDEAKMELLDSYARFALDHRVTIGNVFYLRPRGEDWSAFDARYGPLLDGTAATRLAGAKLTSARYMMRLDPGDLASYRAHFAARGWLDRAFDYTADEPGYGSSWSSIAGRAALIEQHAPGLRTLVTTTLDEAARHGLDDAIDIIVPVVNFIDGEPGQRISGDQSAAYLSAASAGKTYWLYQSCMSHDCGGAGAVGEGPAGSRYPSVMIDHSAMRNRAMEWVAFRYGATGWLYWETGHAYSGDAWASQYAFTGNGDGTLFYPGTPARVGGSGHTPIASQRLKHIRDGVEDYEYLAMVARLGDPDFARSQAMAVTPTAYGIGDDPSALEEAREALATRIEELLGTWRPDMAPPQSSAVGPLSGSGSSRDDGPASSPSGRAGARNGGDSPGAVAGEGGEGGCSTVPPGSRRHAGLWLLLLGTAWLRRILR